MAGEVFQPHDGLFRAVFGEEAEAADLLRAHVPAAIASKLRWSTLARRDTSFISNRLRASEADLLFEVQREVDEDDALAWLYVLLEHQSTPDPELLLRMLGYCIRIWEQDRRVRPNEEYLRPIVPLVLYQGRYGWTPTCEFSELFAPEVRDWPGVPRYAHLLIDQTQVAPDELRGGLRGRAAQLALMVPHREGWPVMERLVPLLAELVQVWGLDEVEQLIVYLDATTPDDELWNRFSDEVRRKVPGGGELMTKTQTMLELVGNKMRQEGRQEGEMIAKVRNIEGLRGQGVSWSTIAAATGVDEDAFGRLKQQLQAAVGSTN